MKITIINPFPDEEEEIIIKCRVLTEDINHLICKLKNGDRKITGYDAKGITLLALPDIFYFEATDNKVFAYGQKNVYEIKEKLYQLEEQLVSFPFMLCDLRSGCSALWLWNLPVSCCLSVWHFFRISFLRKA